jgi:hypothetical protein
MIPLALDVSDSDALDLDVVLADSEDLTNSSGDGLPVDRFSDEVPTLKLPDFLKERKGGAEVLKKEV